MNTLHTVRVRKDWLDDAIQGAGGVAALSERLDCAPSTISRQYNNRAEAGPRFIGSVLAAFPIEFSDAFHIVEELSRTRIVRTRVAA